MGRVSTPLLTLVGGMALSANRSSAGKSAGAAHNAATVFNEPQKEKFPANQ